MPDITIKDLDRLRHMLGAQDRYPVDCWGFRNHYCSAKDGDDWESMQRLLAAEWVRKGVEYPHLATFHATEEGCRAVGLNAAQIKNALGD